MEKNMTRPQLEIFVDEKIFGTTQGPPLKVLGKIALKIHEGDFCCLIGKSGCGKTTLLNIMSGLDRNFSGKRTLSAPELKVAYVFQEPCLLPWKSVRKNLEFVAGTRQPDKIKEVLEELGVADFLESYPNELSLGMARRISIARALLYRADVILLDEPFVSLDRALSRSLLELILGLWKKYRPTFVLVTHDLRQALASGSRVLRLEGSPATIKADLAIETPLEQRTEQWMLNAGKKMGLEL